MPRLRKNGEAPLAAARRAAVASSSGASACMRSSVKRAVGPAMLTMPSGRCWPTRRSGAAMADRPAV